MNIPNFIEKAKNLIRETEVFIEAKNNENIVAYFNDNEAIIFIVNHNNQWMALSQNNDFEFDFSPINLNDVNLNKYVALTIKKEVVYPNFENLLHFGDAEIQEYILINEVDANDLFDLQSIYDENYIDYWMDTHPMYNTNGLYAYKGGWAIIWPYDDAPLQWNADLEFLYQVGLQNEPFIDIYYNKLNQKYICIERNT